MPSGLRGEVPPGTLLLEAAGRLGVELESICGGRQTCGKCQIAVEEGATIVRIGTALFGPRRT